MRGGQTAVKAHISNRPGYPQLFAGDQAQGAHISWSFRLCYAQEA